MTDIKEKALALVNEVRVERGWEPLPILYRTNYEAEALFRAIEQLEAFKQEVSDAVRDYYGGRYVPAKSRLGKFIIPKPKPDPLVEIMEDYGWYGSPTAADNLRAALDARGLKIVEKGQ